MIHSEPLLNILVAEIYYVYRNLCLKIPGGMGTYRRLSHTALSCIVSCVRISEPDV